MLRVLSVFTSSSPASVGATSSSNNNNNTVVKTKKVEPAAPRNTINAVSDTELETMPGLNKNADVEVVVSTPGDTRLPTFDHGSFDVSTLWALGRREHWDTLRAMLSPNISEKFHVTDAASKAWLDSVRAKFDLSRDVDTGMGAVYEMVSYFGGDDGEMVKLILSLGVHPDVPKKHQWRPMHICGSYARIEAASALLLCRPDLTAKNHHGLTPLDVARREKFPEDHKFPERMKQRPKIAALIERYEVEGFPRLTELAGKREWFAVKNLIRRQVVSKSELTKDKYEGKTVLQWAEFHGEVELVQELSFYTKLCLAELKPGAKLKKRLKSIRMWRKKVSPPANGVLLTPIHDTTTVGSLTTSASAPGKLQNGFNVVVTTDTNGHAKDSTMGANGAARAIENGTEV